MSFNWLVNKKFKYAKPQVSKTETPSQIINLFKQVTVSMECANNLIVIKTLAGNASAAGMAIDQMHLQHVVGTVAGDDTLLVVAKTNSDAEIILKRLICTFPYLFNYQSFLFKFI